MTKNTRKIAVFDFDGTLTTKDTLPLFIRFAVGTPRCIGGFLIFAPLVILMKLKLYDNSRCKERLFAWFFKGMKHSDFTDLGIRFSSRLPTISRGNMAEALARHRQKGTDIYVISASIEEWVIPYCKRLGVKHILATQAEVDSNGRLTGRFASPNCYGQEKVRRLLAVEPDRESYYLTAYGDSKGDTEMFALADEYVKV